MNAALFQMGLAADEILSSFYTLSHLHKLARDRGRGREEDERYDEGAECFVSWCKLVTKSEAQIGKEVLFVLHVLEKI